MANSTTTNPIYLDTFSSDVSLFADGPCRIISILFVGTSADDKLILEDKNGIPIVEIKLPTAKSQQYIDFGYPGLYLTNGLICDVSDGTYNTGAHAFIYLA